MAEVWTIHPHFARGNRTIRLLAESGQPVKISPMKNCPKEQEFRLEFKRRLRRMREALRPKISQEKMAAMLGVKHSRYAKWEQLKATDNNFPTYLIPRLCEITGHDPWYVLTEQAPSQSPKARKVV